MKIRRNTTEGFREGTATGFRFPLLTLPSFSGYSKLFHGHADDLGQIQSREVPSTMGWALPHQSLIKKMF